MAEDAGEKTEPASEKRREDFRERGEVARSRDIISVLVLFSALAYFMVLGGWMGGELSGLLRHFLGFAEPLEVTPEALVSLSMSTFARIALMLSPLVGMIVLVGVLGNLAQVGFLFTTKPLIPDLNKLNFITRFPQTFFSKQTFGQLVLNIAKMGVVATVVYLTLDGDQNRIRELSTLPLGAALRWVMSRCLAVLLHVSLVLILIAIFDYLWSRYTLEEKMRMTRQEVKDEHKEMEGNPHVKGQQRKRAREAAQGRMMKDVPTADVIVNNPTHLSIALRYRQGVDAAPVVVAKGADLIALHIRRVAQAHGVPMVENVPLARMLYKHVKVGRPVPSQFFRAVAEVLAFVYRLRAKRKGPKVRVEADPR